MSKRTDYSPEKHIAGQSKALPFSTMQKLLNLAAKKICKINCGGGTGTGFFCNINIEQWKCVLKFRVLMTNWHVLKEDDIKPGKKIYFSTNSGENKYEIEIDEQRETYTSKKYDVTIIEIKEEENIKFDSFFEIDDNIYKPDYNFKDKSIYLLHYPKGNEPSFSQGKIKDVGVEEAPYQIEHLCDSDHGSSGGPLINTDDYKVIGIHKGASNLNFNLGTLLKEPIIEFQNQIKKIDNKNNINNNIKGKNIENVEKELIDNNEDELTIKYKIEDIEKSKKIRIFGDEFVKNNENICKIIIKKNELALTTHKDVDINELNDGIFEIKLKGIKNITDIRYMFSDCKSLFSLPDISKLNTENVTDMSYMFCYCESLSSLADISKWNTHKVANMSYMFCGCNSLISLPDISKWNTENVTNMSCLFSDCKSLESLPDISEWNTQKVTDMK